MMEFKEKLVPKLVSSETSSPHPLSAEQVQHYWDHGYLVIKKLYHTPLLNLFRERFIEIVNMPDASFYYSIVKDPKLIGQNPNPELYVNKDLYYFPFRPVDKIIAVWTAVDPVTRDNGCLYVLPGSHKIQSLYVHGQKCNDKNMFFHGILNEETAAPLERRVQLEMEPGDTVIFHPYLVHGSGANSSQHYRKAMTAHYAHSDCYYIDVRGTPQEVLSSVTEKEIRRRGGEFNFVDLWRVKSKQVKGVRSNL